MNQDSILYIRMIYLPLCFMALLNAQPAWSITLEDVETLYQQGNFLTAAERARSIGTAKSYSLASRAMLVEATYKSKDKNKYFILEQAMNDAIHALELDPSSVDAHLQMALALGSIADLRNPVTVYLKGYAKKGKYHIDQAMKLAPDNPWVHGVLGVWNLQIVRKSSKLIARKFYGATEENGTFHCDIAQQNAPNELQLIFGCAVSLYELEPHKYEKKAVELLKSIVNRKPENITDSLVINQADIRLKEYSQTFK